MPSSASPTALLTLISAHTPRSIAFCRSSPYILKVDTILSTFSERDLKICQNTPYSGRFHIPLTPQEWHCQVAETVALKRLEMHQLSLALHPGIVAFILHATPTLRNGQRDQRGRKAIENPAGGLTAVIPIDSREELNIQLR
ncbi:MAG: hypothetical protein J3R72DRAFT_491153 [Linnemannia gamsii]|nr:MAG: hypothetical protein J3R72DRAFT_491153 [Linnemannia gamsii]